MIRPRTSQFATFKKAKGQDVQTIRAKLQLSAEAFEIIGTNFRRSPSKSKPRKVKSALKVLYMMKSALNITWN